MTIPKRGKTKRTYTPTREWMIEHYVNGTFTAKHVREITGYSKTGFTQLLKRYDIQGKGWSKPKLAITRDELYQLHVVEGLTAVRIAAQLGCHNSAISRLIKEYELDPQRPLVNIPTVPSLERDVLWKLYWVDKLSAGKIAVEYKCARSTVLRWMKQYDIPTRRWNGGEFERTYTRNPTSNNRNGNEFCADERERIFQRDGNCCRMPGCGKREYLEVHHIVPIKYGGRHDLMNGITLCKKCHNSIMRRELDFVSIFQHIVS